MRGIKIPQYEFVLKMQGGRICGTLRYCHSLLTPPLPYSHNCSSMKLHMLHRVRHRVYHPPLITLTMALFLSLQ